LEQGQRCVPARTPNTRRQRLTKNIVMGIASARAVC
jgi:hypothetical protein